MRLYVGLDWASSEHAVCVVDEQGAVQAQFRVAHSAAGLAALRTQLRPFGAPAELPVAIERPSGVVVDTLVEAGFPVIPIHPNVVQASRPRYHAAPSKSDPHDAYLLADLLRTDGHRFRRLRRPSDATRALRALVRGRDDLVATRVMLANQLRALVESFWPGAALIFAEIDSPIALAFLARFPTPQSAAHLGRNAWPPSSRAELLRQAAVAELLGRLHAAPVGHAAEGEADAKGGRAYVRWRPDAVGRPAPAADRGRRTRRRNPPRRRRRHDVPRAGRINAAQILAELGDDRARFATEAQRAAEAGVAPYVRLRQTSRFGFRWACNKRLRQAITCFADISRHSRCGPPLSTNARAPAAAITRTPFAFSPAPAACAVALLVHCNAARPTRHGGVRCLLHAA